MNRIRPPIIDHTTGSCRSEVEINNRGTIHPEPTRLVIGRKMPTILRGLILLSSGSKHSVSASAPFASNGASSRAETKLDGIVLLNSSLRRFCSIVSEKITSVPMSRSSTVNGGDRVLSFRKVERVTCVPNRAERTSAPLSTKSARTPARLRYLDWCGHDLFFLHKIMVRLWFDCLKMGAFERFLSHQCALVSMSYVLGAS